MFFLSIGASGFTAKNNKKKEKKRKGGVVFGPPAKLILESNRSIDHLLLLWLQKKKHKTLSVPSAPPGNFANALAQHAPAIIIPKLVF
jgi:hypothetical protein